MADSVIGERNDGTGAVTAAYVKPVDIWAGEQAPFCFLCGLDIHDAAPNVWVYTNLENGSTMHYSHVGERVDYGVWMGTGYDLTGARLVDDGTYLGYEHPTMQADGYGVMWPGDAHYERLSDGPSEQRFRVYESGDVGDPTGSTVTTLSSLMEECEGTRELQDDTGDDLREWLATNPQIGDVTPWGNTSDLPARRIV